MLLQRAAWKRFAPGRWTGLGGKVEPHELNDLTSAAWRELFEETDLQADEVSALTFRRFLCFVHPEEGLVCLAYFTGETRTDRIPACHEGTLHWVAPDALGKLDLIENTGRVLALLVEDVRRDRPGIHCGHACYDANGQLQDISFDCAPDPLTRD